MGKIVKRYTPEGGDITTIFSVGGMVSFECCHNNKKKDGFPLCQDCMLELSRRFSGFL